MKNEQEIKKMKQEDKQTFNSNSITETILPYTTELSHKPSEYVETQNENIIMINRSDYETLKKRYGIAKTALEAVLCFIVPQNLRDLVNKAMMDIKKADEF